MSTSIENVETGSSLVVLTGLASSLAKASVLGRRGLGASRRPRPKREPRQRNERSASTPRGRARIPRRGGVKAVLPGAEAARRRRPVHPRGLRRCRQPCRLGRAHSPTEPSGFPSVSPARRSSRRRSRRKTPGQPSSGQRGKSVPEPAAALPAGGPTRRRLAPATGSQPAGRLHGATSRGPCVLLPESAGRPPGQHRHRPEVPRAAQVPGVPLQGRLPV